MAMIAFTLSAGAVIGALVGIAVRARLSGLLAVLSRDIALGIAGAVAGVTLLNSFAVTLASGNAPEMNVAAVGAILGALLLTSLIHALPHPPAL